MIAVGFEEITESWYSGLSALHAITTDTIRPFDAERDGTLFGEGSGAVVLETAESAGARGAHVYGKVLGYEMNNDAYHMTAPDPRGDGTKRAMETALARAGIEPGGVDYVNAHGTGTPYNDKIETAALKEALGDYAYDLPVVSIKSMISHMMGAAGIVEAISCFLSIRDDIVPPTVGLTNADPECDLDYVAGTSRHASVSVALTNSSGIGGTNCALVLGAPS
jgi:3-oxoacyl-[acyl-carrier-protein] synthase II